MIASQLAARACADGILAESHKITYLEERGPILRELIGLQANRSSGWHVYAPAADEEHAAARAEQHARQARPQ